MDYTALLATLNNASLFELYRLNAAIHQQLEDPKRNSEIKTRLKPGLLISYFDHDANRLKTATIIKLKRTRVLVKDEDDGGLWNIAYYHVNIDDLDVDMQSTSSQKVSRSTLKVGDNVGFKDKQGNELFGEVVKLNPKTAGVLVGKTQWRVAYGLLSTVMEGELWHQQASLDHK